ncbi:MAG: SCO family protein [Phenylobacterium sp.]|uniref:SCO family protein n=1 Tax=Phenylobacterium sp. TaxID=1871053 RepID=UPI0025F0B905|nr:SCO family protein [Phenylobacterium sp.]MBI1200227.1 SCO family protein [Phenylobacterium sp.]
MISRAVLAVIVALVLAAGAAARPEPFDPFGAAGVDQKPGAQIPLDRRFQDETGRTVSLRELADGKPLVLAPVQHRCPNLCALTLEGLRDAFTGQSFKPGKDFVLVALGIDPHETRDAAELSERRMTGGPDAASGIHALTGKPEDIAAVTKALGYRYAWDPRIGQYAHIAAVAVLTPKGKLARWLYGLAPKPEDFHLALIDAGQGQVGDLGDQIRLLCYHYDPVTGQYSNLIWSALRWGGGLTIAGLAGIIGFAMLRERRRRRVA